ncbi:hypothetical protein QR680_017207 [Steinernema hermaphroditum]|uniref:tRNA-intron lyase n=1 Tax=Steinernema hermaphroditum TaxID=289476 RepID=A0AA39LNY3_9BILA|nr:hypothetical protein QR680_017207 [Steinernema hermaphroditum]
MEEGTISSKALRNCDPEVTEGGGASMNEFAADRYGESGRKSFLTTEERRRIDAHDGDILELLPSCSFFLDRSDSEEKRVVDVEFCNGKFFLWRADDVDTLKMKYRIWISSNAEKNSSRSIYSLMPEQAQVLFEHELIRIRRLRNQLPSQDSAMKRKATVKRKHDLSDEQIVELARRAVQGRKVKALKRKANGEFASAAINRVKPTDIKDVEVEEDELAAAVVELREKSAAGASKKVGYTLPTFKIDDDAYEVLDAPSFPTTEEYRLRLVVYRDLWRKGFYLTEGFKFGCAFLAYEGVPGVDHSHYMVRCIASDDNVSPQSLISISRVASQVRKSIILAVVSSDSLSPYYLKFEWWRVQ